MASLVVQVHDLNSESAITSPKNLGTHPSSEDVATSVSSPKLEHKSCLCSPTTHEGSFRCRFHRSSSGYWGKRPMPSPTSTPTPKPTANGVVNGTEQSVESQSNIADAFCTSGLTSDNPTYVQEFQDVVSSM